MHRLFSILWVLFLTGCVSDKIDTKIETTKTFHGNKNYNRIIVVANLDKDAIYSVDGMQDAFQGYFHNCGVSSQFLPTPGINVTQLVNLDIPYFHPDAVLTLSWTSAAKEVPTRYGIPTSSGKFVAADYSVTLTDLASRTVVWRADMNWHGDGVSRIGRLVASTIINRMAGDGVIAPGCRIAEDAPAPPSGSTSGLPPNIVPPDVKSQSMMSGGTIPLSAQ